MDILLTIVLIICLSTFIAYIALAIVDYRGLVGKYIMSILLVLWVCAALSMVVEVYCR